MQNYKMNEKDKFRQIQAPSLPSIEKQQQTSKEIDPTVSTYLETYRQTMDKYKTYAQCIVKNTIDEIRHQNNITYNTYFVSNFQLKVQEQSINKQVIVLNAKWGYFSININILNIEGSNTQHLRQINRGMYGSIYFGQFNKNRFLMKCVSLQTKDSRYRVVKEWFLTKVASILGVGPKVGPYFGFDILMFSECAQFAVQQCEDLQPQFSDFSYFYRNLAVLHEVHFVHQDIKPENLMFSPSLNKPVFIDFGLSKIINENIGSKSLSHYVGTINFWGPEMNKCFIEKKKKFVDLYYNDLYGLQQIILCFKNSQLFPQYEEQEIILLEQQKVEHFGYLSLCLAKFYIYQNCFNTFAILYKEEKCNRGQLFLNLFQTQIFLFFEQLSPTKEVKTFFKDFVTDKYKQMTLYSKLNILYQIGLTNVCSLQIFKREDKYNYFDKICSDILYEGSDLPDQNHQYQNIAKFMIKQQLITNTPFLRYLPVYLQYISYICNKYKVSSDNRVTAAKKYYQIFISENYQSLEGRLIIQSTITHALGQILSHKFKNREETNEIIHILFKIYDFLVILDIGTSSEFITNLEEIYEYLQISRDYQKLFVLRVSQSNHLNLIRLSPKYKKSRGQYFVQISEWVNKKIVSLEGELQKMTVKDIDLFDYEFKKQFALEIILTYLEQKKIETQTNIFMTEVYYQLLGNSKTQKIVYYLPIIFRENSKQKENIYFCKQIHNIFKSCFRDDILMNQFSFDLELYILEKFFYKNNQIMKEDIIILNDMLLQIQNSDLCLLETLITKIWNTVQSMEYLQKINLSFFYETNGFLYRFLQSLKFHNIELLKNTKIAHNCKDVQKLYSLLVFSRKISQQKRTEIKLLMTDKKLWSLRACSRCENIKNLILEVDNIHYFFQMHAYKLRNPNYSKMTIQQILDNFFDKYIGFFNLISSKQTFIDGQQFMIERGLQYGQRMCGSYPQFQDKYHCIQHYYGFVAKNKIIPVYFQQPEQVFKLRNVLNLFKNKGKHHLALCLYSFTYYFRSTLIVRWMSLLRFWLASILTDLSNQQLMELFKILRNIQKNAKSTEFQCNYILVIYDCIFRASQQDCLMKKTLSVILKNIDKLHFNFKRKIVINIYVKFVLSSLKTTIKRQQLYYSNKLIKLMMIDGFTVAKNKISYKGNIFHRHFNMKIGKIGICSIDGKIIKYRKK